MKKEDFIQAVQGMKENEELRFTPIGEDKSSGTEFSVKLIVLYFGESDHLLYVVAGQNGMESRTFDLEKTDDLADHVLWYLRNNGESFKTIELAN